jgi:large subunit ribosomal protein L9
MKVVFLEEVEGTARTGDVKNVADGFARNFLLPRKLAAPATEHYINIANAKATKEVRRQAKLDEDAQKLVPMVEGKAITIEVRVGEQDKMFGSVTTRDIAELLSETTKVDLEHRQIDLKQPIREIGAHEVAVKLTRNVVARVTVNVEPIGGLPQTEESAAEPTAEAPPGPSDEEPSPAETADAAEEATREEEASAAEPEPEADSEATGAEEEPVESS